MKNFDRLRQENTYFFPFMQPVEQKLSLISHAQNVSILLN